VVGRAGGVVLAALLAWPATATAVPNLQITEHAVPASAATGEVIEARVTVTNMGDTATESTTDIYWDATNDEGFSVDDFELRRAVCPPGSADTGGGRNLCIISGPIAPGASVTAIFSGSSRFAASLQARATVSDQGNGITVVDTKPFTISGPTIPLPLAARITSLTLAAGPHRAGQRARLTYRLERRAKTAYAMLLRCTGRRSCRHTQFVLNSVVAAPRKAGRNTLRYRLPGTLDAGRYRIRLWTSEPRHRDHSRSVTFRVGR
jgi:hypothetical protein